MEAFRFQLVGKKRMPQSEEQLQLMNRIGDLSFSLTVSLRLLDNIAEKRLRIPPIPVRTQDGAADHPHPVEPFRQRPRIHLLRKIDEHLPIQFLELLHRTDTAPADFPLRQKIVGQPPRLNFARKQSIDQTDVVAILPPWK